MEILILSNILHPKAVSPTSLVPMIFMIDSSSTPLAATIHGPAVETLF